MATEIVEKKKHHNAEPQPEGKSKGLNTLLWLLVVAFFSAAAIGNIYFEQRYSVPIRVIGVTVAILIALGFAAITNQGKKFITFFKEARAEGRKVVWPTRGETRQTTLIVIAVTVLTSLFFWAIDSIIVSLIDFLTNLRF